MTVPVLEAAKFLGKKSKWRLSNLEMQKIIYLAHMMHLGSEDAPLVYGYFEAWDYGPVHPELYHYVKMFGAGPITNDLGLFDFIDSPSAGSERNALKAVLDSFPPGSGPGLVAATHWDEGAWRKLYEPEKSHIIIPNEDICEEFNARLRRVCKKKNKGSKGSKKSSSKRSKVSATD